MRFAKRNRSRAPLAERADINGAATGGTVASEERSALLGLGGNAAPAAEPVAPDLSDATQQLLTGLGRFQRELSNAADDAYVGNWSDEAMNQLIECVEIALAHEWPEMVEALADTGRILQSYEDAGRPEDSLDFLNEAYEILCLMVGDLIVDTIRPTVLDQWRSQYESAVAELQRNGLVLVSDDDEAEVSNIESFDAGVSRLRASEDDSPFVMPDDESRGESADEELPTLDELPPLDSVLDAPDAQEEAAGAEDQQTREESTESTVSSPPPDKSDLEPEVAPDVPVSDAEQEVQPAGPSKLVIEILDQLCAQLSAVESGTDDARNLAIERINGGLRALQREASAAGNDAAVELCNWMLRAIAHGAGAAEESTRLRVAELGYAFCGAYTGAIGDDMEGAASWRVECKALLEAKTEDASEVAPDNAGEVSIKADDTQEDASTQTEAAESLETTAETEQDTTNEAVPVIDAPAPEPGTEAVHAADDASVKSDSAGRDDSSAALLLSAQRAASLGDATNAKRFALEAAAAIAKDEMERASRALNEAETRLRSSMNATAAARESVTETEGVVNKAASRTHDSERVLGDKQAAKAEVEQDLEDLRTGVEEIDRQIAELQRRRAEECEKISRTETTLRDAQQDVASAENTLESQRSEEGQARAQLESNRQKVSDLQHATDEIESEVRRAREQLEEKTTSSEDIAEAVRQICGGDDEREEGMLF